MLALAALATQVWFACPIARADGAFPDSLGILLPSDRPDRIIAATNFGLLISDDDGASFRYVCEDVIGTLVFLYQLGPAPDDRIFAVSLDGLHASSDSGCSFNTVDNAPMEFSDVFPDPGNPMHVLAIATFAADGTQGGVFESNDGAMTFAAAPLYLRRSDATLTGVEIAKSDTTAIYLSMYETSASSVRAILVRSNDAGATWQEATLDSLDASQLVSILGVDPIDAGKVYLRVYDNSAHDQLAIYDDASGMLRIVLKTDQSMSAFLRRSDGALMVGSVDGEAYVSTDQGATFMPIANPPHLRALGERNGHLYAIADNQQDGYAVGVSDDQGASWQPLLRFKDIQGLLPCGDIPTRCSIPYTNLVGTVARPSGPLPLLNRDSSIEPAATASDAGSPSNCGCSVLGRAHDREAAWLGVWVSLVMVGVARRRTKAARGTFDNALTRVPRSIRRSGSGQSWLRVLRSASSSSRLCASPGRLGFKACAAR